MIDLTQHKETEDVMKLLLQESQYTFNILMETGGNTNSDFADYTSNNFIRSFRHILQKPDLSRAQLASMLRQAERQRREKRVSRDDTQWAQLLSALITQNANSNAQDNLQ